MSFDNTYPNRKDHRKKYYDSKRFDTGCRNHGSCGYCESSRTHKNKKRLIAAINEIEDFENDC